MTISELISSLRGMNKEWSTDSRITDRFIYNEAISVRNVLLKQEEGKARLYRLSSLFKTLNKVELIEVDTVEACCIDSDCMIKRTKDRMPKLVESVGGFMIKNVMSLDGSQVLTFTTDVSWGRKLSIGDKHAKNELYYFIKDGYLYAPNIDWDYIIIEGLFEDPDEVDKINSCEDITDCRPAYERDFAIPNYLEKGLKDLVNESLLRYYHRYRDDMHPNKNPQS